MITIREYREEDWKRCCEIHDLSRIEELRDSVDLRAFLTLEETAENEGLFDDELWVAEKDKLPVGFVAFSEDGVTWLYVHPENYKQGIGKALLNFAIEKAGNEITVEVLSENKPAIALYEKLGFIHIETRKGTLEGNETFEAEGFIMQLKKNK